MQLKLRELVEEDDDMDLDSIEQSYFDAEEVYTPEDEDEEEDDDPRTETLDNRPVAAPPERPSARRAAKVSVSACRLWPRWWTPVGNVFTCFKQTVYFWFDHVIVYKKSLYGFAWFMLYLWNI